MEWFTKITKKISDEKHVIWGGSSYKQHKVMHELYLNNVKKESTLFSEEISQRESKLSEYPLQLVCRKVLHHVSTVALKLPYNFDV